MFTRIEPSSTATSRHREPSKSAAMLAFIVASWKPVPRARMAAVTDVTGALAMAALRFSAVAVPVRS